MKKKTDNGHSIAELVNKSIFTWILFSLVFIGVISLVSLFIGTMTLARSSLSVESKTASERIVWAVKSYKNVIEDLGTIPIFSDDRARPETKAWILEQKKEEYGLLKCGIITLDGKSYFEDSFLGDRKYFVLASSGNIVISDPIIGPEHDKLSIIIAGPVWKGGKYGGVVHSVVWAALDPIILNKIVEGLSISPHTSAYIINRTGDAVASTSPELVLKRNNNILNSQKDPSFKKIAGIERKMIEGQSGSSVLYSRRKIVFCGYHPIAETLGWSLAIFVPAFDLLQGFYVIALVLVFVIFITIIIVWNLVSKIGERVSAPVKKLADKLERAAAGDIGFDLSDTSGMQETDVISTAIRNILGRLEAKSSKEDKHVHDLNIKDLGSSEFYQNLCNALCADERLDLKIRICDTDGQFVAGNENADLHKVIVFDRKKTVTPVMMDEHVVGFISAELGDKSILDDDQAKLVVVAVAGLISSMMGVSYRQILQSKIQTKKMQGSLNAITELTSTLSDKLKGWIKVARDSLETDDYLVVRSAIQRLIDASRENLTFIDKTIDYAMMTDINSETDEEVYTAGRLVEMIRAGYDGKVDPMKCDVAVEADESVPDALLGSSSEIAKIVERLVLMVSDSGKTFVDISCVKDSYCSNLSIQVVNRKFALSTEALIEVKMYLSGKTDSIDDNYMSNENSLRFISSNRLVTQLNGTLDVVNGKGSGTVFLVKIPQIEAKTGARK